MEGYLECRKSHNASCLSFWSASQEVIEWEKIFCVMSNVTLMIFSTPGTEFDVINVNPLD
jgi:hypothetical protein